MGTWGTGISSNDTYEDINYKFFESYNQGEKVSDISKKLISENQDLIESDEDQNNFWFALAKAQWECKELDPTIYQKVKHIIESEIDIKLWEELEASKSDIAKRRKVLKKFLEKISSKKVNPKKRKRTKLRNSIFKKGDCLIFNLEDGDYCGAFVLEAEKNSECGLNLIAVTDIKKKDKPTLKDFRKAKILSKFIQIGPKRYEPRDAISWYYANSFKKAETKFQILGNLKVTKNYYSSKDYQSFSSSWDNLKTFQDFYYSDKAKGKPKITARLKNLRKKYWL